MVTILGQANHLSV